MQWINAENLWIAEARLWSSPDAVVYEPTIKWSGPTVDLKKRRESVSFPSKTNRAHQTKRSDDTFKNIKVDLQDIDEAILYYFQNVIKPTVIEDEEIIEVPIRYGDPELWKSIQKDGFVRDEKGKVIAPVVMFRRTSITRDDSVPIDKADRSIVQQFPIKWSPKNSYDRFSLLTGVDRKKTHELYSVYMPDYIVLSYESIIWTSFVTQMNKIVEQIYYSEGAYWGEPGKFKFSSRIDSFDQNIDVSVDKGRIVRSNFNLEIRGYLVPESANDLITTQKQHTKQQVVIGTEFVTTNIKEI